MGGESFKVGSSLEVAMWRAALQVLIPEIGTLRQCEVVAFGQGVMGHT
jgi:hypothetical protein